jgi:hypothetical protein
MSQSRALLSASERLGYRCDGDSRQVRDGAVASPHNHGSILVRRSELVESDVPSGYSGGHAASASQAPDSSDV